MALGNQYNFPMQLSNTFRIRYNIYQLLHCRNQNELGEINNIIRSTVCKYAYDMIVDKRIYINIDSHMVIS